MRKNIAFLGCLFILGSLYGQVEEIKSHPKHEVGFSVGAFPLVGFLSPPKDEGLLNFGDYGFEYSSYEKYEDGGYEKMYHLGSFALNYNYHFNRKHSLGASLSWVGRHIEINRTYYESSIFGGGFLGGGSDGRYPVDTVNGIGWKHYFTLQGNYRYTYYRKNNISLYFGIHYGAVLCVRDKKILPKETIHHLFGYERNDRYYLNPAFHLNAFGIDIGRKNMFNMELGIGTQGIIKVGYKYKF